MGRSMSLDDGDGFTKDSDRGDFDEKIKEVVLRK